MKTAEQVQAVILSRTSVTPGGCWEWTGNRNPAGYGKASIWGRTGALVHRLSWEAFVGKIPEDLTIDHLCFNPPCANPEHLRLLTIAENHRNKLSARKTHCKHGHEYTPENTRTYRGMRRCKTCDRIRSNVAYHAKKGN
jgi:hypothetical protein